jgi:hypothetical protein
VSTLSDLIALPKKYSKEILGIKNSEQANSLFAWALMH